MRKLALAVAAALLSTAAPAHAQYNARDGGWKLKNDGLNLEASSFFGDDVVTAGNLTFICGADGYRIGVILMKGRLGDASSTKLRSVSAEIKSGDKTFVTSGSIIGETTLLGGGPEFDEAAFLRLLKRLYDNPTVVINLKIKDGPLIGGMWSLNPQRVESGGYDATNAFGRMTSMCPSMLPR